MAPLALNPLHIRVLVLGQQLGLKLVDSRLARNALGRALRVAREHDHVPNAQRMQVGDGLADPGLEWILDAEHAHNGAIDCQIQRRQALHLGLNSLLNVGLELRTLVLKHKVCRADNRATPFDGRSDAVCHDVLDGSVTLAVLEPTLASSVDDGACHRMREMLLQASGKAQDLGKRLKVLCALDHDAHLGSIAHGGHDGNGTRELECTRVVDHQRRRGLDEATCGERDKAREQEVPRDDLVGKVLHMRLAFGLERVGCLHERDD